MFRKYSVCNENKMHSNQHKDSQYSLCMWLQPPLPWAVLSSSGRRWGWEVYQDKVLSTGNVSINLLFVNRSFLGCIAVSHHIRYRYGNLPGLLVIHVSCIMGKRTKCPKNRINSIIYLCSKAACPSDIAYKSYCRANASPKEMTNSVSFTTSRDSAKNWKMTQD